MNRLTFFYHASLLTLAPFNAAQTLDRRQVAAFDPCQKLPVNNATWQSLNIDQNLTFLADGQTMSLPQYAKLNGAENFICGIGESCNAGQLCHPVQSPAWQVLYAAQEYNNLMNSMVNSINYALSELQSTSAAMLNDLVENITESRLEMDIKWVFCDLWRAIAYGSVTLLVMSVIGFTTLGGGLVLLLTLLQATVFGISLAAFIQGVPKTPTYESWTQLSYYIAQAQANLVGRITEALETSVNSGISSPNGFAKILKSGTFLQPPPATGATQQMESSIQFIFQGRMITRILRSQDECKGAGAAGARSEANVLSYCDPVNKVAYNIVRAHKKKTHRAIYNAAVINNKYGFSTEFLAKNALECQQKYGRFEHDPFSSLNGTLTPDMVNYDCLCNLPVCDMRLEEVKSLKYDHHKTTVSACRKGAGVPI